MGMTRLGLSPSRSLPASARQIQLRGLATPVRPSYPSVHPRQTEGAGKAGCLASTHGPPATKKAGGSHHRPDRNSRPSLRDGVNGLYVLSPVNGLSCHRRLRDAVASQGDVEKHRRKLDTSVAVSGPHDFAVRHIVSRLAQTRLTPWRPSHPGPNVRDDREAPLLAGRDAGESGADLPDEARLLTCVTVTRRANERVAGARRLCRRPSGLRARGRIAKLFACGTSKSEMTGAVEQPPPSSRGATMKRSRAAGILSRSSWSPVALITLACGYGFRAHSLCECPGMTEADEQPPTSSRGATRRSDPEPQGTLTRRSD
jgi:hypothetical protein